MELDNHATMAPPFWSCGHQHATRGEAVRCLTSMWDDRRIIAPEKESQIMQSQKAADFCQEAARLVGGPRAATHGDKMVNFKNIALLWTAYINMHGVSVTTGFTAHDVGCMMELFKIARRFSGSYNPDDYIDAAGYAGCAGEIASANAASTIQS